jgi:hypothetical protein
MAHISTEQVDNLVKLAKRNNWNADEEFDVHGFSGGQTDDAYEGGYDDGQADLARKILAALQGEVV